MWGFFCLFVVLRPCTCRVWSDVTDRKSTSFAFLKNNNNDDNKSFKQLKPASHVNTPKMDLSKNESKNEKNIPERRLLLLRGK